jgi:type IV secretory pathway component VirB8
MQNDAPSRGGGVTEPNEFDEFRRRVARGERRRRTLVLVLDVLTALALLAIAVLILKMILF